MTDPVQDRNDDDRQAQELYELDEQLDDHQTRSQGHSRGVKIAAPQPSGTAAQACFCGNRFFGFGASDEVGGSHG
jgi:hypothetical protein